jgi:hypothetical protein
VTETGEIILNDDEKKLEASIEIIDECNQLIMRNKSDEALALFTENIDNLCEKNLPAVATTVEKWSRRRTDILIDQKKYERLCSGSVKSEIKTEILLG